MQLGLFGVNGGTLADPQALAAVVRHADEAGIESVFTGEHTIVPDPQVPPSHVPPGTSLLHPSVALSFIAAVTSRLRLGTAITLLPQFNPVVIAKEYGTLDHLSGGRLVFGIGVGYVPQEFDALGVDYSTRGAKTDESIDAIRELWTAEHPRFDGQHVRFADVNAYPRPVQQPPPILVGGSSTPAYRRVVERGDGWIGTADPEKLVEIQREIEELSGRLHRPESFGPVSYTISAGRLDAELIARYDDLGVDRIIAGFQAWGFERDVDGYHRWVDAVAELNG